MSYEISGKIIQIGDVQQISEKFKKREFVIETEKVVNPTLVFTDFVKFQILQDRVSLIDNFNQGDMIKVNFDIRGNKWEKNGETMYFTNLEAWKVESLAPQEANHMAPAGSNDGPPVPQDAPPGEPPLAIEDDELPF